MTTLPTLSSQIQDQLSTPILTTFLTDRQMGLLTIGSVALHFGLVSVGFPGWQCPIRHTFGIPCPGCGLSRSITALIHGDWQTSLNYHAFAPFFLIAFAMILLVTLLPQIPRNWVIGWINRALENTGVASVLLILFVFYWLARLIFMREAFFNLILG